MNIEEKDFIILYKNVYQEGYCQHLINEFERLVENGAGYDRQKFERSRKHEKNDMQLNLNIRNHHASYFQNEDPVDIFFNGLQSCYEHYSEKFSVLQDIKIKASVMKMQRTSPGGGYHVWHAEQGPNQNANRVLVYMLYLNTLSTEEAGETEFLYQRLRLQPEENVMVMWPASYTHPHRGNVVHGQKNKYIVTGWFYCE